MEGVCERIGFDFMEGSLAKGENKEGSREGEFYYRDINLWFE